MKKDVGAQNVDDFGNDTSDSWKDFFNKQGLDDDEAAEAAQAMHSKDRSFNPKKSVKELLNLVEDTGIFFIGKNNRKRFAFNKRFM